MHNATPNLHLDSAPRPTARQTAKRLLALSLLQSDSAMRWQYLEAAHIVGQMDMRSHWRTHAAMLGQALRERNPREVSAQLLRLVLVPLGHMLNRLPAGNPGSGRVNAFTAHKVPLPLAQLITQAQAAASPATPPTTA